MLPADFGQSFDLLYIQPQTYLARGQKQLLVEVSGDGWHERRELSFSYERRQQLLLLRRSRGRKSTEVNSTGIFRALLCR